jgi:hypothetical protein
MRIKLLLCLVLLGASLVEGRYQSPSVNQGVMDDRYSIAAVNSALRFLQRQGVGNSIEAKGYMNALPLLGDRVSVAVLKIYTPDDLVRTENTEAYLTVVRNAFSSRTDILETLDTDPKITLFVLEYLKEKEISSPGIEKRIEYMERCVKDFSCSGQSEREFFQNH